MTTNVMSGEKINKLSLNEIFAGEKESGRSSNFKLEIEPKNLGIHEKKHWFDCFSSGLLVATGSGSSAWLFSARRYSVHDL